ncbi:MAG TPA: GTPase RsgA, partial [Actinomycetota bacterium]|nr:GTPase RsgA [Actinomycetota bacterium]
MSFDLASIGWTPTVSDAFDALGDDALEPARVTAQHRGSYVIVASSGYSQAVVPGRMSHRLAAGEMPAVGDWVGVTPGDPAVIAEVLPRATRLSRKVAGLEAEEQVLAANVDLGFVVAALDGERNDRRIERYLTLVWEGGARPVVVVTKIDLDPQWETKVEELRRSLVGTDVVAVSNETGDG